MDEETRRGYTADLMDPAADSLGFELLDLMCLGTP